MRFKPGQKIYRNYFGGEQPEGEEVEEEEANNYLDDEEEEDEELVEEMEPIYQFEGGQGAEDMENNDEEDESEDDDDYDEEDYGSEDKEEKNQQAQPKPDQFQIKVEEQPGSPRYQPSSPSHYSPASPRYSQSFNSFVKKEDINPVAIKEEDIGGYEPLDAKLGDPSRLKSPSRLISYYNSSRDQIKNEFDINLNAARSFPGNSIEQRERIRQSILDSLREKEAKRDEERRKLGDSSLSIFSEQFLASKGRGRPPAAFNPYMAVRDIPDRFMQEGLGAKRNFSYREYREKIEKMMFKGPADLSAQSQNIKVEEDIKKKRERKEQQKKRIQERKVKILKSHYLNDDIKLKVDLKPDSSTKILQSFREKVVEFNKKEKKSKQKLKNLVDTLCEAKSNNQLTAKTIRNTSQLHEIKMIAEHFKISNEEAEKVQALKKEIDQMHQVIQNAKINGIPIDQNEREFLVKEIEQYKQGHKNSGDLKNIDELDEENVFIVSGDYVEDLEVIMNVFLKRLEAGNKKTK